MNVQAIPTYKVTAVDLGTLEVDQAGMLYEFDYGHTIHIPCFSAAIEGNGVRVLVDSGVKDPDWVAEALGPAWIDADQQLDRALGEIGWTPSDVDIVINTHLHHDHCANNVNFPNAEFVVSAVEWDYCQDPIFTQRLLYRNYWLTGGISPFRYRIVTGDYVDVVPGIRLITTPGHTPGHVAVLINTDEGVVCATGDSANNLLSFSRGIPPAGHTSVPDALASLEKIRANADRLLMAHDMGLARWQNANFPVIPPREV
jgi:glyoxylase-like metal-dependent hydrolase (beta-lactamase superfamily II)